MMVTRILGGFLLASVAALGVLGLLYRGELRESATLRQANEANLRTIERMESDAIINEAKAIADALERREMAGDIRELEKAVTDAVTTDCRNPGLDAVIDRRRLQRERDGNPPR